MSGEAIKRFAVAGIPRSGTTMMFRALAGMPRGSTTPKNYAGPILKTHTAEPKQLASVRKAIFMFGDPVTSVVSTRLNRWNKDHFENCGVSGLVPETADIYGADILGYEKMFDAWMQPQPFKLVCVRYEKMHQNLPMLNAFFSRHLYVPPFRARATDPSELIDPGDLDRIKITYSRLIEKIEAAGDITVFARA